jgi:NAD(P)-dependent dehydrogenase (short-subunit alcohol dehydrogenase family)
MKNYLITGCSRGIGLATANLLLKNKEVSVIGTSTSGQCPVDHSDFRCHSLDLSSSESIKELSQKIAGISFDVLINNAAVLLEDWNQEEINMKQLRKTFDVNFFGTIEFTEQILNSINEGGHIINISSEWGAFSELNFDAHQPHYKMSKTALNMYTKLLSKRVESKNITVSAFDPGWTQTGMGGRDAPRKPQKVAHEIVQLSRSEVPTGVFWHQGKIRQW